MNNQVSLDYQVNRLGFWCAVIALVTGVIAMALPLDAPEAYNAEHADRIAWLNANRGAFIAGWVNQIVAMFSLSAAFACAAWVAAKRNALLGILGAFFVAMATMAFIIPKFMAIWTIPMLAEAASAGGNAAAMSDALLLLLNVSVPFSLYTSFDYLGFWLYSVFALLAAAPQWGGALSEKIASASLGVFGLIYQVLLIMLLLGAIAPAEIEGYFLGAAMLLLSYMIAMIFVFRNSKNT